MQNLYVIALPIKARKQDSFNMFKPMGMESYGQQNTRYKSSIDVKNIKHILPSSVSNGYHYSFDIIQSGNVSSIKIIHIAREKREGNISAL